MGERGGACCREEAGLATARVGGAYCRLGRSLLLRGRGLLLAGAGVILCSEGVGPFWIGQGFAPTLEILGMGTGTLEVGDTVEGHLGVRTPVP